MLVYLINFALVIFWGNLLKDKKVSTAIILIQMFLMLAFGDISLGIDSKTYFSGYEYIAQLDFTDMLSRLRLLHSAKLIYPFDFEGGYVFLNWVVAHMGFGFKGFLVIISAFMMFSLGKFIMEYAEKPWLSILLYVSLGFFTYDFGILRQALALHILLFAFPAVAERNIKKFLFYVFMAFLIHRTAVIFIPLYFLGNRKFTKNTIAFSFCLDFILVAFMPFILKFIIFPVFSYMGKGGYIQTPVFVKNNLIILMLAIMAVLFIFCNFEQCQSSTWRIVLWAFTLSVFVEIAGCYIEALGRIIQYYYIAVILLIPKVIYYYRERDTKILVSGILLFLLLGFYIHSLNDSRISSTLVPYKIFF